MKRIFVLAVVLMASGSVEADARSQSIYIEFLWSKPPKDSIARQETIQFLTQGKHDHQICVAANFSDTDVGGLSLDVLDASGKQVSHEDHPEYRGVKHCYLANLGSGGHWGMWTITAKLGDGRSGSAEIRVDPRIEESPLFLDKNAPYIVGRPSYDRSIPPQQWQGRLVWAMTVDSRGKVTHVDVEIAEGVGERIKDRAIVAGYLTVFSPDPNRSTTPLIWRRELSFAPD